MYVMITSDLHLFTFNVREIAIIDGEFGKKNLVFKLVRRVFESLGPFFIQFSPDDS